MGFCFRLAKPHGLAWNLQSGRAVNERDEIGDDLVPDYMTSPPDGGFYGWPYSYFGQNVDVRAKPPRPDLVAKAIKPDYALGAHTASLGLTFDQGSSLQPPYRGGAFVGQHGSWNRSAHSGDKVIFVPFRNGKPASRPKDILTGFIGAGNKAMGRPVGVTFDKTGALLVAVAGDAGPSRQKSRRSTMMANPGRVSRGVVSLKVGHRRDMIS